MDWITREEKCEKNKVSESIIWMWYMRENGHHAESEENTYCHWGDKALYLKNDKYSEMLKKKTLLP